MSLLMASFLPYDRLDTSGVLLALLVSSLRPHSNPELQVNRFQNGTLLLLPSSSIPANSELRSVVVAWFVRSLLFSALPCSFGFVWHSSVYHVLDLSALFPLAVGKGRIVDAHSFRCQTDTRLSDSSVQTLVLGILLAWASLCRRHHRRQSWLQRHCCCCCCQQPFALPIAGDAARWVLKTMAVSMVSLENSQHKKLQGRIGLLSSHRVAFVRNSHG